MTATREARKGTEARDMPPAMQERPDVAAAWEAYRRVARLHSRVRGELWEADERLSRMLHGGPDPNPDPAFLEASRRWDHLHRKAQVIEEWLNALEESIHALIVEGVPPNDLSEDVGQLFPAELMELDAQIEALQEIRKALKGTTHSN